MIGRKAHSRIERSTTIHMTRQMRDLRSINAVEKPLRMAISIPEDDEDVVGWLKAQHNVSTSLRLIIKQIVPLTGNVDYLTAFKPDGSTNPMAASASHDRSVEKPDESGEPAADDHKGSNAVIDMMAGSGSAWSSSNKA